MTICNTISIWWPNCIFCSKHACNVIEHNVATRVTSFNTRAILKMNIPFLVQVSCIYISNPCIGSNILNYCHLSLEPLFMFPSHMKMNFDWVFLFHFRARFCLIIWNWWVHILFLPRISCRIYQLWEGRKICEIYQTWINQFIYNAFVISKVMGLLWAMNDYITQIFWYSCENPNSEYKIVEITLVTIDIFTISDDIFSCCKNM